MATKLLYDVNGKPKAGQLVLFAFQQVLAVLAATVAVPNIIGLGISVPCAILGAGIGTLVYLLFTKFKSPVIISSSFAFLGALANAVAFGYMGILLGTIFAGLVYVIIAVIIHFTGTAWVSKLLPPVVIGPTVAVIGLSLAGNAVGDLTKSMTMGYNLIGLLCGLLAFFTIVICSVNEKWKTIKAIPFIIGILVGYAAASIFTIIGNATNCEYLKIVDWSLLKSNFTNISFQSFISLPRVAGVEAIKELVTGTVSEEIYWAQAANLGLDTKGLDFEGVKALLAANNALPQVINGLGIAQVALAFIPVAFVTFTEHIADHKNLSSVIDHDLVDGEPGLKRTLLGDGVGSIAGTFFGICPNTTYGESVGCTAITKNASVRTILTAACMLVVLSFITPITLALRTIPSCVMGGVCLTLYGFIAVSGLKMLKDVDLGDSKNLFVVAAVLIAGIGGLAINIPVQVVDGNITKVITITSVASALILGIVTNVIVKAVTKNTAAPEVENKTEAEDKAE
ncbi:MAG: uracil-xanthine permease [Bacilli bacterium]|nr:uracil-xanthine permease [Bacilli bacterium]